MIQNATCSRRKRDVMSSLANRNSTPTFWDNRKRMELYTEHAVYGRFRQLTVRAPLYGDIHSILRVQVWRLSTWQARSMCINDASIWRFLTRSMPEERVRREDLSVGNLNGLTGCLTLDDLRDAVHSATGMRPRFGYVSFLLTFLFSCQ